MTIPYDSIDPYDGQTSLRQAVDYANQLGGPRTITFTPALAGQTIALSAGWAGPTDTTVLRVSGNIIIHGPATGPGVTIAIENGKQLRPFVVKASGNLTLENLTVSGGAPPDYYGGGVISFGALTVRGCTFTGNSAQEAGAILGVPNAPLLLIENSTFAGNTAPNLASAISSGATVTTLRHVTISNNSGANGTVWLSGSTATLTNTIVAGNNIDGVRSSPGTTFTPESTNNLLGPGDSSGLANGVGGNLVGVPAANLGLSTLHSCSRRTSGPSSMWPVGSRRGFTTT